MITKNEEQFLKQCLDSIKDLVDEIILVDTGSTDKTKEIAKNYNAKIFDFKWIDDFSAALEKKTTKTIEASANINQIKNTVWFNLALIYNSLNQKEKSKKIFTALLKTNLKPLAEKQLQKLEGQ